MCVISCHWSLTFNVPPIQSSEMQSSGTSIWLLSWQHPGPAWHMHVLCSRTILIISIVHTYVESSISNHSISHFTSTWIWAVGELDTIDASHRHQLAMLPRSSIRPRILGCTSGTATSLARPGKWSHISQTVTMFALDTARVSCSIPTLPCMFNCSCLPGQQQMAPAPAEAQHTCGTIFPAPADCLHYLHSPIYSLTRRDRWQNRDRIENRN